MKDPSLWERVTRIGPLQQGNAKHGNTSEVYGSGWQPKFGTCSEGAQTLNPYPKQPTGLMLGESFAHHTTFRST